MEEKGDGEHTFGLSWEDLDGEFPYMIHLNPKTPACPKPSSDNTRPRFHVDLVQPTSSYGATGTEMPVLTA